MGSPLDLRPSPIAGQWYPADPKRLAASVDGYISDASIPALPGEVIAVMAPHAGHRYSGPVAGYAFAALRGSNPDIVVVASPMHYFTEHPLLTSAHSAYATPFGPIPIDRDALEKLQSALQEYLGFGLTPIRNDPEHSLEIELPFLQRALESEFLLLPVMVRATSARVARGLGGALSKILRERKAILVASTDLSHFYPQEVANDLDGELLRRVESLDPDSVLRAEEEGKGFACGRGALAAVLWAAKDLGADRVQILRHATSGDVTGDYSQVVGYGSAVILRSG
jgi:AmmeMemoRadiSam system protein B